MGAYQAYFAGQLKDESYDERELAQALSGLPAVAA
jgi:tryptophan synthase beta chain